MIGGKAESPSGGPRLSPEERERWIVEHVPFVRMVAYRIARRFPSHIEGDELVSIGLVGLIEAVDRFDPTRGVPFRAFADIRIRGAIVDAIRHADWIPRVVRRKYALIDSMRRQLRQKLGRDPDRAEMAAALEITPDAFDDLTGGAVVHRLVSLDAQVHPDGGHTIAEIVPDDKELALDLWIGEERREALHKAIGRLPSDERTVISLYYEQGLKFHEIGRMLGVCESRVCQLRGQAVTRIRKQVRASMAS